MTQVARYVWFCDLCKKRIDTEPTKCSCGNERYFIKSFIIINKQDGDR